MLLCFFVCFPTNFQNVSGAHSTHVCIPPPRPWYRSSSLWRAGKTVENFFNMIESRLTIKMRCTQKRRERWNYRIKIVNLRERLNQPWNLSWGFHSNITNVTLWTLINFTSCCCIFLWGSTFGTFLEFWTFLHFFATLCPFCVSGQFSLHSEIVS